MSLNCFPKVAVISSSSINAAGETSVVIGTASAVGVLPLAARRNSESLYKMGPYIGQLLFVTHGHKILFVFHDHVLFPDSAVKMVTQSILCYYTSHVPVKYETGSFIVIRL